MEINCKSNLYRLINIRYQSDLGVILYISLVERQKGQKSQNQKGAIAVQSVWWKRPSGPEQNIVAQQ